jgi:type VI secretion system secreted protein VgrG
LLAPTTTAVSVIAPALTASTLTGQTVTLLANVGGGSGGTPNSGTVNFNLGIFGTVNNVAVVNGVAQTTFTIPVGAATPNTFTVSATYGGNAGFKGSTSSGSSNGTLYFCQDAASTLLSPTLQLFAVLAGSTVTNTGTTNIFGNVGVTPGTAVTGIPPGIVNGTIHSGPLDAVGVQAQNDLTTAFTTIQTETGGFINLTGKNLGGLTLTPGRYNFDNSAQLTGTLTLNDLGNPAARFDFQIGSTLTTASSSRILFINGGADNVYWEVGSSATIGTSTVFAGNILALTSITLNTTASIACGRALARNGAVTMDTNFIDPAAASQRTGPAHGHTGAAAPTVAVAASASAGVVSGTSVNLSVLGADQGGAATLVYTWSLVRAPAGAAAPNFSANGTNAAQNMTAIFRQAGTYSFQATIIDRSGLATTSVVTVTVRQTLTHIGVTSSTATVQRGAAQQFAATAFDQFDDALAIQPGFSWSITRGIGTVSRTGQYMAPVYTTGTALIQATSGRVRGTAPATVV